MAAEIDEFWVPTVQEMVNANLRVRRNGLIQRGVSNPNVTKDSDHYVYATALAHNLAPAFANLIIMSDQQMPDTAEGARLVRWLDIFGLSPLVAVGATGNVILSTSVTTLVPVDSQLIDDVGQVFRVTVGGNYANGDSIAIVGISTGASTKHAEGDVLQWVDQPAFADTQVVVGAGGLFGGADTAGNEGNRDQLYSHLRNPAGGGNWSQIIQWAMRVSPSVQSAFVYPALNGPGTVGLCLLGPFSLDATFGFSREVSETVRTMVHDYVSAQLDANKHVYLTTQTPKLAEGAITGAHISIGLDLPYAAGAGGLGGGWVDPTPWPVLLGTATRIYVQSVTDTTHITLTSNDFGQAPSAFGLIDGVTQISWFSRAAYMAGDACIFTSTVVSHSGTTGAITVVLDAPFPTIESEDFVFPASENGERYAQLLMTALGTLGPGEWYPNLPLVPQAARQPLIARGQQPSDLAGAMLKPIVDAGDEVEDAGYLYRSDTTPGVPATLSDSPMVIVPYTFGFYDKIP
jgi:uncharacterized phage protein gp47/JayE